MGQTASAGFEPANLGTKGQHATSRPPKVCVIVGKLIHSRIASDLVIFCFGQVYHVTELHVGEKSCSVYTPCVFDASYKAEVMLHYAD